MVKFIDFGNVLIFIILYENQIIMKAQYLLILFILISNSVFAQNYTDVEDVDKFKKYETYLMKTQPHQFEKVEIVSISPVNNSLKMVSYSSENGKHQALVNAARKDLLLIANYSIIAESEVPEVVLDKIETEYPKSEPVNYFAVTQPSTSNYFAVDLMDDKEIIRLHFDELGRQKQSPY